MGRKFTCSRSKPIKAPIATVYLKNPVGSNEWHREKRIGVVKRQIAEKNLLEAKAKNMSENKQTNWNRKRR